MVLDPRRLCLDLLNCDTEDGVIEILDQAGLWQDEKLWRYYGDDELNWNRAGNQQVRSDFALNEKLVNMIDSRLMLECMLHDIAPESEDAPQSVREGINRFIEKSYSGTLKVTGGRVEDWPATFRTQIAQDMAVFATGPRDCNPCISIADLGEGQTPQAFPHTLLSLGKNNKIRVNFVQGKFGQGSTGAIRFCGEHKLQLIVSKRHPELVGRSVVSSNYPVHESDHCWGFTIVRREGFGMKIRSPFYSYLAPLHITEPRKGEVLRFEADEMPIFPESDRAYERHVTHGTLVKLYEYRLKGASNVIRRGGLRPKIDLLLTEPALPLRFHECREQHKTTSAQVETMSGLFARLRGNENLEEVKPERVAIHVGGHELTARIFAFKPGTSQTYRGNEGVVFTINGQTQGYIKANFFSRPKRVGLQKLAKDLLVVLDCSSLGPIEQDDLFMPSRDRLVEDNDFAMEIEKQLEYALRTHSGLRLLKNERSKLEVEEKLADDKPLEDTLNRVLRNSPTLARIFGKGLRLPNANRPENVAPTNEPFVGKPHPTYFRFAGKEQEFELMRSVHMGRRTRLSFETDAVDDYFDRKIDAGVMTVEQTVGDQIRAISGYLRYLSEGRATLHLHLPNGTRIGDILSLTIKVSDPVTGQDFINRCSLTVLAEAPTPPGPPRPPRPQPGDPDGTGVDGNTGIDMPKVRWVSQKEGNWHTFFSSKDDCLFLTDEGERKDGRWQPAFEFYLNADNRALQYELQMTKIEPAAAKKQFEVGVVLIGMALIHDDQERNKKKDALDFQDSDEDDGFTERAAVLTRAIAPIILPMIQSLGDLALDEVDASDLAGQVA